MTEKETRTLICAADGKLEGQIVPFIQGLPFTGNITLHYSARNVGFVDGDVSILTIKLPDEFKYVASVPEFSKYIKGTLHIQALLGHNETELTPEMIETYTDRIIIYTPHTFWIGVGEVEADLTINYGEFLTEYPSLPISDAPLGYIFMAQLKYDSAMWDVIKDPILGTNDETYITKETTAIVDQ
ncbi:hypothetical protein EFE32_10665 [Lactococcus lactis subsp. lactis]|nr:hypothetical protein [Lactococcus lactis subsp. lactis]